MPSRHAISCSWMLVTALALHGCGSGSSARPQDAAQAAAAPAPVSTPAPGGAVATAGAASRDVVVAIAEPAIEVGCTYDGNQIAGPPGIPGHPAQRCRIY